MEYTVDNCPPELLPMLQWKVSDETLREIEEIEQWARRSAHQARSILLD